MNSGRDPSIRQRARCDMGPGLRRDLSFCELGSAAWTCGTRSSRSPARRAGLARNSPAPWRRQAPGSSPADINDCGETLALVKDAGPEGLGVKLDVTDPPRPGRWSRPRCRRFGRLDALINNAALYGACTAAASTRSTRRVGRRDGGQRQGHLELLQGGGAGDAPGAAAAASSTSPRSPRPTACPTGCTTRPRRRR